jgi:ATP-dependent exoDNAse (exonuclease V) alpha subunit
VDALIKGIKEREGRQTFLLLAPTGKAATRLSERTRIQTKTIHLALIEHDWINESNYKFKPDGKPLVAQNIIVDEASMIDLELMGQLFRAIDWNRVKRFVLLGDPNQLPPIGFGRPFLDIINFLVPQSELKNNIASLTINCRQLEENSMALRLAEVFTGRMRSKNYEEILSTIDQIAKAEQRNGIIGEDLEVHFWKDEHDVEEAVMKKLRALLKDEFDLSGQPTYEHFNKLSGIPYTKERGLDYFQILTPYRGYYYGTAALNVLIQNEFRGGLVARRQVKGFTWFDKVIQVHNTTIYRKDKDPVRLFNGQLGYVKTVWNNGDGVYVKFLDITDDIPFTESGRHSIVENLELGYAITIHKAQGSDFQIVFLVIPKENTRLLSRELLYTALTRSKKKTVIFLQDDIEPLLQTMSPSKSAISERNTSIFVFRFTSSRYYENDLIHQTTNGDRVRSKSEVIIANELKNHGISYEYEKLLWSKKGDTFKRPDFTVFYEGEEYYWEHLGRMDDPAYVETWEAKRKWYEQNGFTDRLVLSEEDSRGLDSRKIVETIETRFR